MKVGNQYIIPFKGLKDGEHTFNFEIDKAFFEEYTELEIPDGFLEVIVVLNKKTNLLVLDVATKGTVKLQCDKCLDYFDFDLKYSGQLFVKFKELPEEPDDNVIFLHPNEDILDLNQYFFDSIGLSLPIQKYHPAESNGKSGCNKQMLKILKEHTHNNKADTKDIDPRWSKLKDLLED